MDDFGKCNRCRKTGQNITGDEPLKSPENKRIVANDGMRTTSGEKPKPVVIGV